MDSVESQVRNFLSKCEDLTKSQFILAPYKIAEILRAIAVSPVLVSFFEANTRAFDYLQAQEKYMIPSPDDGEKATLLLPDSDAEKIAFIFCLLADIDNQVINFNGFLQTFYLSDDGSYSRAFLLFCRQLIRPLQGLVYEELIAPPVDDADRRPTYTAESAPSEKDRAFSRFALLAKEELAFLAIADLSDGDREAGTTMLNALLAAAENKDEKEVKSLLIGYHYFLSGTKLKSEKASDMLRLSEEL